MLLPPRWPGHDAARVFHAEAARLLPGASRFADCCLAIGAPAGPGKSPRGVAVASRSRWAARPGPSRTGTDGLPGDLRQVRSDLPGRSAFRGLLPD